MGRAPVAASTALILAAFASRFMRSTQRMSYATELRLNVGC